MKSVVVKLLHVTVNFFFSLFTCHALNSCEREPECNVTSTDAVL